MDTTEYLLKVRALAHALDLMICENNTEDASTLSMILVDLVDNYDQKRV